MRRSLVLSCGSLMLLLFATTSVPAMAMTGDGRSSVDLTIDVGGISLHVSSHVGEDGGCCGLLELKLDTDGALVPDLKFLQKLTPQRLRWSF